MIKKYQEISERIINKYVERLKKVLSKENLSTLVEVQESSKLDLYINNLEKHLKYGELIIKYGNSQKKLQIIMSNVTEFETWEEEIAFRIKERDEIGGPEYEFENYVWGVVDDKEHILTESYFKNLVDDLIK